VHLSLFLEDLAMKLPSLRELLVDELKDLYSAETQLVKALPKVAKHTSTPSLKEAITNHLEETRGHVERLQQIAEILDCKVTGKKCKGMEGLLEEGDELLNAEGNEAVLDAGIVAAAQRVEHYEMAAYGSARTMAELLGHEDVVALLQQTLDEEKAADQKLTEVVESEVYPQSRDPAETSMEEGNGHSGSRRGNQRSRRAAHKAPLPR
jgi:ferritin-like metal-binding protein YciE